MANVDIAIIGRSGQVAQALTRAAAARGVPVVCAGRPDLHVASLASVTEFLSAVRPRLVINAAAYTAVDKAETEPEATRLSNVTGPETLARACRSAGLPLIHLSTDYVFDGSKRTPYVETDPVRPLGVYGASKAIGEDAVRATLDHHVIVRTAWVYGADGQNFLKTMLRLGAERDVVRVVNDQVGAPTLADDLAEALLTMAQRALADGHSAPWGTYHVTAAGETTWHGFAAEIFRLAAARGLKVPRLEAIPSADYPTPASRPAYSVLDNTKAKSAFGIAPRPWAAAVPDAFARLYPEPEAREAQEG